MAKEGRYSYGSNRPPKGVTAYCEGVRIRPDPRIDEAGNYREKPREVADKVEATSRRSERYVRPLYPSDGLSADMKFGGGVGYRSVQRPGLKRYV
jgi:hypothetical protein